MAGERERWELLPGLGVGPLRFGMSRAEVAEALQASGPHQKVGGPYAQEDFADGVQVFYGEGRLACVAMDAVAGPQVFLTDFALAGRDPEEAYQYLLDHAADHGHCLAYTPDESLALTDLGLLLRVQQIGDVLLSRPLFVMDEWLESEYYCARGHLPLEGAPVAHGPGEGL
ncbi:MULTISPECIES: hypothetical protein [Streptomyces]|uniref:Uncharacterized protein n=1 Tax=Streptomyces griseiscabiei TaxID=2993540 RepID=A0ABU4LC02_9ACTN|nr:MULTISPECIES: hypothetical protein [Streptomyces]MDX2913138.1 hypothetical protein [Streptomyces griseiscabiei]